MSAPALAQKKAARNAAWAKAATEAASKSAADAVTFEKEITEKAKNYEAEYNAVSLLLQ